MTIESEVTEQTLKKVLEAPSQQIVQRAAKDKGLRNFVFKEMRETAAEQFAIQIKNRAARLTVAALEPTPLLEMLEVIGATVEVFDYFDSVVIDAETQVAVQAMATRVKTGTDTKPLTRRRKVCAMTNVFLNDGILWKSEMPEAFSRFGDEAGKRVEWALGLHENRIERKWKATMENMMEMIVKCVDLHTKVSTTRPGQIRYRGRQRPRHWSKGI